MRVCVCVCVCVCLLSAQWHPVRGCFLREWLVCWRDSLSVQVGGLPMTSFSFLSAFTSVRFLSFTISQVTNQALLSVTSGFHVLGFTCFHSGQFQILEKSIKSTWRLIDNLQSEYKKINPSDSLYATLSTTKKMFLNLTNTSTCDRSKGNGWYEKVAKVAQGTVKSLHTVLLTWLSIDHDIWCWKNTNPFLIKQ